MGCKWGRAASTRLRHLDERTLGAMRELLFAFPISTFHESC